MRRTLTRKDSDGELGCLLNRCRVTLIGTDAMARKVRRVPVRLELSSVSPLSDEEIRTILRGSDDLIMSGGRSLLARVQKAICTPNSRTSWRPKRMPKR